MNDLVSIIMPSYNTGTYIGNTIDSVLSQTHTNWELIIVDDCSGDNTDEVVASYDDIRIRYLKNEGNSGAAVSRNRALREAKGRYIAFLDSDDLWEPNKLKTQLSYMKEKGYAFTYTDYRIRNSDGSLASYICIGPTRVSKWKLYCYCYFFTSTVMYDASVVGLIQIADLKKNNDYAMWFRAAEKTRMYRLPQCLATYCRRDNSISAGSKLKLIRHHYILYRQGLGKAVVPSLFYTGLNLVCGVMKKLIYKKSVNDSVS